MSEQAATLQNMLRGVTPQQLIIGAAVGAFIGWLIVPGAPETAAQQAARAAAVQRRAAGEAYLKANCDPLYAEWDRVYKLHGQYGDNVATQADVDLAKGLWSACVRAEP